MRDAEALTEFLSESWELLDLLDRELVLLENETENNGVFNSVFRVMHTLKGNAGFLAFAGIEKVSHVSESLLEKVRDGELSLDPKLLDLLFRSADQLRLHFLRLEKEGHEGPRDETLISELEDRLSGSEVTAELVPVGTVHTVKKNFDKNQTSIEPQSTVSELPSTELTEEGSGPEFEDGGTPTEPQYARVRVDLLDWLMNLMGELVLCRNELVQISSRLGNEGLTKGCQRLNLVTAELQDKIGQTRMQPLERLTSRFPRFVRDLAKELGKDVQLRVLGQETGLDRTLLDAIRDPLLHLIRNSIDHGIESPERRVLLGKSPQGTITISACQEGGQVRIDVADDGGGIEVGAVRKRALEAGFLTEDQLDKISEKDLLRLIFEAGFSTTEKVTKVSGRGVGMDVVRSSVESIGGSVDLNSQIGQSTTITLRVPLTLAIIPALIVEVGPQSYAIPQNNLQEIVHLEQHLLDSVHGNEVYRLRGRLVPILRLRDLFGVKGNDQGANVVVVQADGRLYGLVVDASCDTAEIVVKPLPSELRALPHYAGATITGQGDVALILDVGGIARSTGMFSQEELAQTQQLGDLLNDRTARKQSLLLFHLGRRETYGIPLGLVSRLEEFSRKQLRETAGRAAVEYRGKLMPLLDLATILGQEVVPTELLQVLVFSNGGRRLGIIVGEISDIVEDVFELDSDIGDGNGVLGATIIQGRAVTLLDVLGILRQVYPEWLGRGTRRDTRAVGSRVLLAHDSEFFRSVTRSYLELEGYDVLEASRQEEAMDFLSRENVDSVVVDIDMEGSQDLLLYASGEHPSIGVRTSTGARHEAPVHGIPVLQDLGRDALIEALRQARESLEVDA